MEGRTRDAVGYAGVVIDLDGVCYRGDQVIDGSVDAVRRLRDAGIAITFATNNATRTPEEGADKLRRLGYEADPDDLVTSAVAAAAMIEPGSRCMVVGMGGLRAAVLARGCEVVEEPEQADVVVTGLDTDITYERLTAATRALLNGARFVAANDDHSYPTGDGIAPGAGALLAALETASQRTAEVAGKPERGLYEAAAAKLPDGPLLMIGDKVETDIAGAAALGWDTALVLTGVSSREDAEEASPPPTYVADDLAALVGRLLDGDR